MFIKSFKIKNFRQIENMTIKFNKNLNIIIGPNNSGKTTIIDALRICLTYKDYDSLKITKNDFHIKYENLLEDIEFNIIFEIEKEIEKAVFSDLYNINPNSSEDSLSITYIFSFNQQLNKIKSKVFGGYTKDNKVSDEIFDYITNFHLSALRDANRFLTPGRYNILSSFFSDLKDDNEKSKLINEINDTVKNSDISDFIKESTDNYIQKIYKNITFNSDYTQIKMTPIDYEFDEFTKNWKILLPSITDERKILDIKQNGLGYNNLIYISVLLSRLNVINEKTDEEIYISLSIEEPEAHLQPQLQNIFFSFLNSLNEYNQLQIFITSHSPTLTAKADLNSLILIQNSNNNVEAINLTECFTEEDDLNYLRKFLDVTKSQLLFSKKIIFVEGISEAILIPVFAKKYGINLDKEGVEIVNLQGINIKHFFPLFNDNNKLKFKGVFLTDDDRKTLNGEPSDVNTSLKIYNNDNLKIFSAKKTFEYELICSNGFESEIFDAFKNKHPKIFKDVNNEENLFEIFNQKTIQKADIALNLSQKLENNDITYNIPKYIKLAFDFLKEN